MPLSLATLGGRLEVQQLPPTRGDSSGLETVTKEVGVLEPIGVAVRERFRGLFRPEEPDERRYFCNGRNLVDRPLGEP